MGKKNKYDDETKIQSGHISIFVPFLDNTKLEIRNLINRETEIDGSQMLFYVI